MSPPLNVAPPLGTCRANSLLRVAPSWELVATLVVKCRPPFEPSYWKITTHFEGCKKTILNNIVIIACTCGLPGKTYRLVRSKHEVRPAQSLHLDTQCFCPRIIFLHGKKRGLLMMLEGPFDEKEGPFMMQKGLLIMFYVEKPP